MVKKKGTERCLFLSYFLLKKKVGKENFTLLKKKVGKENFQKGFQDYLVKVSSLGVAVVPSERRTVTVKV